MNKFAKAAGSFVLGLVFFWAGAAVAIDVSNNLYPGVTNIAPDSPHCFEVGKSSELGGDCFCVDGELSSLEELDCLVESGVVPANEYEAFKDDILGRQTLEILPEVSQCAEIGKTSESGGDCYCVAGSVTDMQEVECLIESGVVSADSYDSYRRMLGALPAESETVTDVDSTSESSPELDLSETEVPKEGEVDN